MNLNNWYNKGISAEAYRNDLDKHKEHFYQIYDQFQIPEADLDFLKEKSHLRVVALAEVWCGHCMMDVPILHRMAEAANMEVSMLPRDEHLELMDQYKVDGKRYIPIFIFIDEAGNEIGKWGPMTSNVKALVNQLKEDANLPEKEDPQYKEAFQKYAQEISNIFATDETVWTDVYQDIKKALS